MRELPILNSKAVRAINRFMEIILILTSAVVVLLVTYYVVTRYLLHWNFNGFEEIAILLIVWMYFIGSANASREQSHIAADMLDLFIKKITVKKGLQLFYRLVGLIILGVLLWLSFDFMHFNAVRHVSTITFKWPMYIYHFSMVLGFTLMLFYDACHFLSSLLDFRTLLRGKSSPGLPRLPVRPQPPVSPPPCTWPAGQLSWCGIWRRSRVWPAAS